MASVDHVYDYLSLPYPDTVINDITEYVDAHLHSSMAAMITTKESLALASNRCWTALPLL